MILARLDADIIHLDEVESCSTLELLLELLPSDHGYKAYLSPGKDTATGKEHPFTPSFQDRTRHYSHE